MICYSYCTAPLDSSNTSWVWPGESDWQFVDPGGIIISDCKNWYKNCSTTFLVLQMKKLDMIQPNAKIQRFSRLHIFTRFLIFFSSCEAGVLHCQSVPGCHVDGGWGQWGAWSECSLPCGRGVKVRRRQCDNPAPQSGGRGCLGVVEQLKDCNIHLCTGRHA